MNIKRRPILFLLFLMICLYMKPVYASDSTPVAVHVYNELFWGTLTKEDSKTVFTTLPYESRQFTITGKWKKDTFKGNCTIHYSDGTQASVVYKNAAISGDVKLTMPDGSEQTFSCNEGNPYGKISYFSPDGELEDADWFYLCTPIREWVSNARSIRYDDLMASVHDYWGIPLHIQGKVAALYETPYESMIKLESDDGHYYLLKYPPLTTARYEQPDVSDVSVGDTVSTTSLLFAIHYEDTADIVMYQHASGYLLSPTTTKSYFSTMDALEYYMTLGSIEDKDFSLKTYPVLSLICLESENNDVDPLDLDYSYVEICKYPLFYKDSKIDITGTIVRELDSGKENTRCFIVREQDTFNYYLTWFSTKKEKYRNFIGKLVSFTGTLQGNAKTPYFDRKAEIPGYLIYPRLKTTKITIEKKSGKN